MSRSGSTVSLQVRQVISILSLITTRKGRGTCRAWTRAARLFVGYVVQTNLERHHVILHGDESVPQAPDVIRVEGFSPACPGSRQP